MASPGLPGGFSQPSSVRRASRACADHAKNAMPREVLSDERLARLLWDAKRTLGRLEERTSGVGGVPVNL